MKTPVNSVVSRTPIVDNVNPGPSTGFISPIFVSRPPVKSITHKATIPTNCAWPTLLKCIPRPSLPNNIPATRNNRSVGMPKRPPAFVMRILQKTSIEPTKIRFSEVKKVIFILYRFLIYVQ
jgi:hypothetical protein